jgi:hypothetical protein
MPLIYILATSPMILAYKVVKAIRGVPRGSVSLGSGEVCVLGGGGRIGGVI